MRCEILTLTGVVSVAVALNSFNLAYADNTGKTVLNFRIATSSADETDKSKMRFENLDDGSYIEYQNKLFKPEDKTVAELGITHFVTDNFALNASLALPTKYKIKEGEHFKDLLKNGDIAEKNDGKGDDFSFKQTQITLNAQYHFTGVSPTFIPYVGGGIASTSFADVKGVAVCDVKGLDPGDDCKGDYTKNSTGLNLQAGFNYLLNEQFSLNAELKIPTSTFKFNETVTNLDDGEKSVLTGKMDQSPVVIAFGVGYTF